MGRVGQPALREKANIRIGRLPAAAAALSPIRVADFSRDRSSAGSEESSSASGGKLSSPASIPAVSAILRKASDRAGLA